MQCCKAENSLYSGEENRILNTVANMVAKIDIDVLKIFFLNQKQMRLKISKKLKTASLNSIELLVLKKNSVLRLVDFLKKLKPIAAVNLNVYRPTTSIAL